MNHNIRTHILTFDPYIQVARFAARGGREGAKNPRNRFGAELADPYAAPDESVIPYVDAALRVVCEVSFYALFVYRYKYFMIVNPTYQTFATT